MRILAALSAFVGFKYPIAVIGEVNAAAQAHRATTSSAFSQDSIQRKRAATSPPLSHSELKFDYADFFNARLAKPRSPTPSNIRLDGSGVGEVA